MARYENNEWKLYPNFKRRKNENISLTKKDLDEIKRIKTLKKYNL